MKKFIDNIEPGDFIWYLEVDTIKEVCVSKIISQLNIYQVIESDIYLDDNSNQTNHNKLFKTKEDAANFWLSMNKLTPQDLL